MFATNFCSIDHLTSYVMICIAISSSALTLFMFRELLIGPEKNVVHEFKISFFHLTISNPTYQKSQSKNNKKFITKWPKITSAI